MADLEPITREELLLNSIAGEGDSGLSPITRQEMYLSAIAGESDLPSGMEPITREEEYYQKILDNGGAGGGGGEAEGTVQISITQNGTITRNVARYASAEITTNVPNPSTGTKQISQNGTHDVTDYASAEVDVPNSYSASDEGKVVSNGELTAQTSRSVTANGTYDTTLNSSVVVAVPASGITPTGTKNITTNGDHDVTQYATAHVDVPTGITPSGSQTYTQNGTYDVTNLAEAVVNVQASGGAEYYTGTIVFSDTDAPSITFPVGIGSNDEFLLDFKLIRTGTVTDGVVTYDGTYIRTHGDLVVCSAWAKRYTSMNVYTPGGNKPCSSYLTYISAESSNATSSHVEGNPNLLSLTENSITFTPSTAGKQFGFAGSYYEYKYNIFVARNAL